MRIPTFTTLENIIIRLTILFLLVIGAVRIVMHELQALF